MKLIYFLLILLFNVNKLNGQILSEKKCEEYSKIPFNVSYPYPHMVSLGKSDKLSGSYKHLCSGVLVSEKFILSAEHCLRSFNGAIELAKFTNDNFNDPNDNEIEHFDKTYKIIKYIYDNSSDGNIFKSNIALLELNETITLNKYQRPACLFTNVNVFNDNKLLSIGWFKQTVVEFDGFESEQYLNENSVIIVENTLCENDRDFKIYFKNGLKNPNFCVQDNIRSDTEFQDSYPLQLKQSDQYFILGVISNRFRKNDPKIFKIISDDLNFIEHKLWNAPLRPKIIDDGIRFNIDKRVNLSDDCGERKIHHKPLITFSTPTYPGEFPWHVAIYLKETKRNKKYICGGTIINDNMILTAAHCVVTSNGVTNPERLSIAAGKHKLDTHTLDTREFEVYEVIVNEKYNREYLEYDIAILKLKNKIEYSNYIQPICLSDDPKIFTSDIGYVAGWGVDELNEPSNILTQATLPIRTNTQCRESNRKFFPHYLNDFNFCAGYGNGTIVCTGDSGGGMMFEYNNRWYIKGIVSLGVSLPNEERCDITELVLFTDVPKFYDWIIQKIPDLK